MNARPQPLVTSSGRRRAAWVPEVAFGACALVAVGLVGLFVSTLAIETVAFLRTVPVTEFLAGTRWSPFFEDARFGVLPLLGASVQITAGACLVALPLGLLTAVFLEEYASPRAARVIRSSVDLLAGIPTVVYGYFALTFVTPVLQAIWPGAEVFNWGSAALVVGLMVVPTVASLSADALAGVPHALREAALGLGATRAQMASRILVPAAAPGIGAAVVLALARAVGETMTVTLAAGNQARFALNPLEGVQTMTAFIAQASLGGVSGGSVEYRTVFAVGALLFAMTFVMNAAARLILGRGVRWAGGTV
ncbi:MAG: phosphate ABC transporter permease subunit PstC [Gemmatimonadetes bacterium]|nr:phosphate ABC transporter permease subunit PstC [Gemmatimonadota bacterium]